MRNPYKEYAEKKTGKIWEELDKDFDRKGELNAWDKKDAGTKIASILDKVAGTRPQLIKEKALDDSTKRRILASISANPEKGMSVVAQVMGDAVYKIVDYAGWARKIFNVKTIAQGDVFRVPKDVDVAGWVVAGDGQTLVSQVRTKYVFPGEFKITAFTEIDIQDVVQANWDIFARGIDRSAQQIMRNEDVRAVALLTNASRTVNDTVTYATLSLGVFEDIRYQVERWRLTVDKFIISRSELSDIVKTMSGQVDFVTQRELILAGYIGNILNAQIITSAGIGVEEVVPAGVVFAVTEGNYLGQLGERLALVSEEYSAVVRNELKRGVAQYEIIGIGIGNSRAVAMGTK